MPRYINLLKFGALIAWNLLWLAVVVGVPLWMVIMAGWAGAAVLGALGAGLWLLKRPAALVGLLLGLRFGG